MSPLTIVALVVGPTVATIILAAGAFFGMVLVKGW